MKTAVVFDSAGTLIKVYRIARDVDDGRLMENVVSTNMVINGPGCALVSLRVEDASLVDSTNGDLLLTDFIRQNGIGLDVVCRGHECTIDNVISAAMQDRTACVRDIKEAVAAVKLKCKDIYYVNIGLVVDVLHSSIPYVLATGGKLFPGVKTLVRNLMNDDVGIYIASGDNKKSLLALAEELDMPVENVYAAVSPSGKRDVVKTLKQRYETVIMVGDGINDRQAFQAADLGVLTLQQEGVRPGILYDSADIIIEDISQVERIIKENLHMIKSKN